MLLNDWFVPMMSLSLSLSSFRGFRGVVVFVGSVVGFSGSIWSRRAARRHPNLAQQDWMVNASEARTKYQPETVSGFDYGNPENNDRKLLQISR